MLKNLKISTKLLVIFALLSITTVLTISFVGVNTAKKSTINNQITMLKHIADLKVDRIESFFNERRVDIKVAQDYFNVKKNLPIVTQFATDRTNHAYISANKILNDQIKSFTNANECYVDFMLVGPEGKVMYSSNELHEKIDFDNLLTSPYGEKAFEKGKTGIYFSDIYESQYEDYVYGMLITAPVNDFDGQFIGVIALELNMGPIYEFIQDTTGLGETGETLIAKRVEDGALFLNSLRHDKEAALTRKAILGEKNAFPILEAVNGRNGSGLSIDYRGKEIIAAWRHIPSLDWGLVAKIDLTEAFTPVSKLKNIVFYISSFIIAIALAAAFLLSISITVPVKKLSNTVLKINQGDFKQRVNIKSRDEIGILASSFNKMVVDLKNSRDELLSSKDYIENVIKSMTDTLVVMTPDAVIRSVNQATCNLLGYRDEELIGKSIKILFLEDELFNRSGIENLIKKGPIVGNEKTYLSKDGKKIPVLFSASVMFDAHRKVQGIVCIAHDITERKKADEESRKYQQNLEKLNNKLTNINKELEAFCYSVSHDLRAPLRSINGFSDALLEDYSHRLDEQGKDYLRRVCTASRHMGLLIDDLLILSRITRSEMNYEKVYLSILAQDIAENLQEKEPERKVEFVIKKGLVAYGDRRLLRIALQNLFDNAWKFTSKHAQARIEFGIMLSGGKMCYFVLDDGAGFDMTYVNKLFAPFQRLHTTTDFEGTGIGLATVQRIINKHGGNVWAEGEIEKGATFYFTL